MTQIKRHGSILILFLGVAVHASFSQTQLDSTWAGRVIGKIDVFGNQKTKTDFILRELKQNPGDRLDLSLAEEGRKRVQNLNLFHRVMLFGQSASDTVDLMILVTERWYWFPYPLLHLNDRDWGKISYGAGLAHQNVRGRGEILSSYFQLGYNPSVQLTYVSPWLWRSHDFSGGVDVFYQQVQSKHFTEEEVDENHAGFIFTGGKRFGLNISSEFEIGYQSISFSPEIQGSTLQNSGTDRMAFASMGLIWDYRDLAEYPHQGWYVSVSGRKTGLGQTGINYWRTQGDFRLYCPVRNSTLAFRLAGAFSNGSLPVYDLLYLGYTERIRGHFYTVYEGAHRALASVAYRIPLIPVQYVDVGSESQMQDWPLGVSLGLFCDTGLVWNQGQQVEPSMLISGYGMGLHFHLPFVQLFRLELALDEEGHSQVIADMFVAF